MKEYENITREIIDFRDRDNQLKIISRDTPLNSDFFFQRLYKSLSFIDGFVSKDNSRNDIYKLLNDQLNSDIKNDPFYNIWLDDMSNLCKAFCKFFNQEKVSFWLGTKRGCKRYHVDMVPFRLLVTYAGQGTELLPDYAADRIAFINGKTNKEILKDKSALSFIDKWDIAIFRGGKEGILHRTPDSALNGGKSILLRLDNSSFLEEIQNINYIL